jgi:rhamnosyl/mannosyltransferase
MGFMSYLLSARPRAHAVVVSWHSDIVRQKRLLRTFAPFMHAVLRRADAIVCATPNHIDTSEVLPAYRSKCVVIPYGISLTALQETAAVRADAMTVRASFGGGPLILAVGRLTYYKGFEHLIRAMRDVRGHLVVIGEGPLRRSLEAVAKESAVADRVHLLGEISGELAPYYHACDVFVLPSVERSEAFGIVQLEAMACGKPVVNTALPSGAPFVSRHEHSGLTVRPGDPGALAAAINTLLDRPSLRRALGEAGRDRVAREFSKEAMATQMLELYGRLRSQSQSSFNGRPSDPREVR